MPKPTTNKTILDSVEESESSNSSNKTPHEIGAVKNTLNVVCECDGDDSVCEKNIRPKKSSKNIITYCLPKPARQKIEAYQSLNFFHFQIILFNFSIFFEHLKLSFYLYQ